MDMNVHIVVKLDEEQMKFFKEVLTKVPFWRRKRDGEKTKLP